MVSVLAARWMASDYAWRQFVAAYDPGSSPWAVYWSNIRRRDKSHCPLLPAKSPFMFLDIHTGIRSCLPHPVGSQRVLHLVEPNGLMIGHDEFACRSPVSHGGAPSWCWHRMPLRSLASKIQLHSPDGQPDSVTSPARLELQHLPKKQARLSWLVKWFASPRALSAPAPPI